MLLGAYQTSRVAFTGVLSGIDSTVWDHEIWSIWTRGIGYRYSYTDLYVTHDQDAEDMPSTNQNIAFGQPS